MDVIISTNLVGPAIPTSSFNFILIGGGGLAAPTLPLPEIMMILLPMSKQWRNIGTMLSLDRDTLSAIETRCRDVPDDCLREMLSEWLEQDDPPRPPTKSALVNAVKMYNPSLAKKINAL